MNKQIIIVFCILGISVAISGCDTGTGNTQIQDIGEVQWQSDGSTMYGFIQSYVLTLNATQSAPAYSLVRFNSDGSLAQTYNTGVFSRPNDPTTNDIESYSPSIYLSSDGNTLVTQLENDLYRYHIKTNVLEKLQTLLHLIVVSPDLHYAVGTTSSAIFPTKTIYVYDLTASPILKVTNFDVKGVVSNGPGIWLNNGTFGITCTDSVGEHISIFDIHSTGIPITVIGGAQTQFHNTVFNASNNDLFVRNHAGKATDYFVDKVNLTTMARTNILNFQVDNFDLDSSKSESFIVYSAKDTINSTTNGNSIKSRNLQSLKELTLTTDNLRYVKFSPAQNFFAYVSGTVTFNQIRVIPFIRP